MVVEAHGVDRGSLYMTDHLGIYDRGQHASYFRKSRNARQAEWKETIPAKFRSMETITLYNMAALMSCQN